MQSKYDLIAEKYDATRCADGLILEKLVFHLRVEASGRYLDAACGSGNYTSALARKGGSWNGIDQSSVMLTKAKSKSASISWICGDVGRLPFSEGSFDGVVCTLAIHHFPSRLQAFREFRRVLARGRFVVFTSTREQMKGYWLSEYFPAAMERSREQMPDLGSIESDLLESGFEISETEPYFIHDGLQDLFLYCGKHRPEMYLDEDVRRGISTFSVLSDPDEIDSGCAKLGRDLESGKINEVIRKYENDLGDYCFVVCE
ncbi:MAG: class I SAM-dependent methyltransferase [Acidobacteriota bacterium]|nr:class I SAM-dependent methyltransferase [Acidobacteriota bacterium]